MRYERLNTDKIVCAIIGIGFLVVLPYFHFGVTYRYWKSEHITVDKQRCINTCWDAIFKGSYEPTAGGYKHVYFNITENTFKMWAFTVICIILVYECISHLLQLYFNDQLRSSMLVLVLSSVYPHYYAWWMYFNAWNDEFYKQMLHQAYFSVTELISTIVVIYLCDKNRRVTPRPLLVILTIAILHVLASGLDQFMENIILKKGAGFQVARDIGLMIPDLLHIVIPLVHILVSSHRAKSHFWQWTGTRQLLFAVCSAVVLLYVYTLL